MKIRITSRVIEELERYRVFLRPHFHYGDALGKIIDSRNSVSIEQYARVPEMAASWVGGLSVGAFSYIVPGAILNNCIVGRHCSIAAGVSIMGADHPLDRVSTSTWSYGEFLADIIKKDYGVEVVQNRNFSSSAETVIEHDVWIGQNALLKVGVNVGVGAVVGANSVVTKSVPAYAIVAGNPARVVRYRFEESERESLLQTEWWCASPNELAALDMSDKVAFISKHNTSLNSGNCFKSIKMNELLEKFGDPVDG